jgi:LysM repeat protein
MARYLYTGRGVRRNRARIRIYVVSAMLIIGVVIAVMYGNRPVGSGPEIEADVPPAVVEQSEPRHETDLPGVSQSKVEPEITPPVDPEPKDVEPMISDVVQVPTETSDPIAAKYISEAMALLKQSPSNIIGAREGLNEVMPLAMSGEQRKYVKAQLTQLSEQWLFSRSVFPGDKLCSSYKVQPGDVFENIGRNFKVPHGILMKINNISNARSLQAGQTLKVINGPFHARIYRSSYTMDLFLRNTYIRSFRVGLGKPGMETPTGLWRAKIGGKLVEPPWTNPQDGKTYRPEDPDYPLGSRWIGLEGLGGNAKDRTGFAIHGTKKASEIGIASSQGCIRMYNGDVILMYDLMMPGHSKVEVVD